MCKQHKTKQNEKTSGGSANDLQCGRYRAEGCASRGRGGVNTAEGKHNTQQNERTRRWGA
jgi:hypothetical protein